MDDIFSDLRRQLRAPVIAVVVFSACINVLMLTGSIYMLQVYDRVLSSRSTPTLIAVTGFALFGFAMLGVFDAIRLRMLARVGALVDAHLSPRVAVMIARLPLKPGGAAVGQQPLRDLDAVRGFLGSTGPTALADLPFLPLFLGLAFLLHPWLGWLAVAGGVAILALTLIAERSSAAAVRKLSASVTERSVLAEAGRRNAEVVAALGMSGAFSTRLRALHDRFVSEGLALADSAGGIGAFARVFRQALQSASLGLGAYLAIKGELSPGAMIAASILTSRALAPIETAVANWKGFVAARQGYARLAKLMPATAEPEKSVALPAPRRWLEVTGLAVGAPGARQPIIQRVSFRLEAGQVAGIIGPSAGGKSTLARALVGIWPPLAGRIALDGAALDQWAPDALGQSIGYLPQDVELFDGTIAENIARLAVEIDSGKVIKAATDAGADAMIAGFPKGYDTRIGEQGATLSGGQRQRIALARALYGEPFLVVLDEPNAHLDAEGEEALARAINAVRARGGVCVVISHRPSGIEAADFLGLMANGAMVGFGPRDEMRQRFLKPGPAHPASRPPSGAGGEAPPLSVVRRPN